MPKASAIAGQTSGQAKTSPGSDRWTRRAEAPADAAQRLVPLVAEAGSIVAMDGRVWHTSGANVTPDEDRALLLGYCSADFLRPETQRDLDPWVRGRLGLDAVANVRVAAEILGATPRSAMEAT